jgi:hypothetical protein
MRPEAQDLDDSLLLEHLVDHAMPDIDPAGIRAGKIADELLEWRMGFKRIFFEDFQDTLRLLLETGAGKFWWLQSAHAAASKNEGGGKCDERGVDHVLMKTQLKR